MTLFRSSSKGEGGRGPGWLPADGVKRLARVVGRVLLWVCVGLLLIRGALSVLNTASHISAMRNGVTVTAPPSQAESAAGEGR